MSAVNADSPRQRLLVATIDHLATHGVNNLSLRQLASALGTSHRMLIYHFGSKEGLLAEVVRAVEERQRTALAELRRDLAAEPGGTAEVARRLWRQVSAETLHPHVRLFFEIYSHALQGDPACAPLLPAIVDAWLEPLTDLLAHAGVPTPEARVYARLGLAATRGLLLDLLATGDRAGVDAAMDAFIGLLDVVPVEVTTRRDAHE